MGKTQNTGNLTNAIAQDSSNNIGIGGAASGSYKFQVTGTTNLTGALSGTSATFSDTISITANNSTAYSLNLLGRSVDNATTLNFFSNNGATRYGFIYTEPTKMEFGVNGSVRLAIASTGAATFSTSVAVKKDGSNSANDALTLVNAAGNRYFNWQLDASGNLAGWRYNDGVGFFKWLGVDYTTGAATFSSSVTATNLSINTTTSDGRIDVRPNGLSSFPIYWRNNNGGYGGGVYVTGGNNMQMYLANSAGTENVLIAATGTSFFNGGNVLIGTTSDNGYPLRIGTGGIWVDNGIIYANGVSAGLSTQNREGSNLFIWIGYNAGMRLYNDALGFIGTFAATTGVYTANSDVRLKENIFDSTSALSTISKLKVKSYDWKHNGVHESFGLIAQDVYEVLPEYVFKPEDKDDNWGISKGELVPMLIKAIQEQQAQIELLSNKIVALESK
jgi:hypothetical protein